METKTLKEFLHEQSQKQDHRKKRERRDEWVLAVTNLMNQCRSWLEEADPAGVMEIEVRDVDFLEEGTGSYRAPSLRITLGGTLVRIVPVGRNTVGRLVQNLKSEGRVDIDGGGEKYLLYRVFQNGEARWYAVDDRRWEETPFDKDRFDEIILRMLS